jgi:hypothetical protein
MAYWGGTAKFLGENSAMARNFQIFAIPALGLALASVLLQYRPTYADSVTLVNNTGSPTVTEGGVAAVNFTLSNSISAPAFAVVQSYTVSPGVVAGDPTDVPTSTGLFAR